MTATAASNSVPVWKHYGWKGLIFPSVVVLVLGFVAIGRLISQPDTNTLAAATAQAAQQGAAQGAAAGPTTEPSTPVTTPGYDYLECSHVQPGDPTPCSSVLGWPLTEGAKAMIGYQKGGLPGELNTANTRSVYVEIRNKYASVDACQLWLSIERDKAMNPVLTVWPSQTKAPAGSSQLVDCAPKGGGTSGTIPTQGAS